MADIFDQITAALPKTLPADFTGFDGEIAKPPRTLPADFQDWFESSAPTVASASDDWFANNAPEETRLAAEKPPIAAMRPETTGGAIPPGSESGPAFSEIRSAVPAGDFFDRIAQEAGPISEAPAIKGKIVG